MFERFVIPGEHVIDQGEAGDNFYIIERLAKKYIFLEIILHQTF